MSTTTHPPATKAVFTVPSESWRQFRHIVKKRQRSKILSNFIDHYTLMHKRKVLLAELPKIRAFPLKKPLKKGDLVRDIRKLRDAR